MPSPFSITVPSNTAILNDKRQAQVTFTVTNQSGHPLRGRAQIKPEKSEASAWLTVDGDLERDFAIAETKQYVVRIAVPNDAPAGFAPFRFNMVNVALPEEDFTEGPTVTFQVPALTKPKPFPWWIILVALALLILIGAVIFFLTRGGEPSQPTPVPTPIPATVASTSIPPSPIPTNTNAPTATPIPTSTIVPTATPRPTNTNVPPQTQTIQHAISVINARSVYHIHLTGPGEIKVRATWSGSQSSLALIINGPGQVNFFARRDGVSPLEVSYTVTPQDFQAGSDWFVTVASFGTGQATGNVNITYPSGASQSPFTDEFVISNTSGHVVQVIVVRGAGSIQAQAIWSGAPSSMALIINGPGQVGFFARQDGGSPLSVNYTVTSANFANGNTWRVTLVSFTAPNANGSIRVTFP